MIHNHETLSTIFDCIFFGVPQGSVLSPTLSIIHQWSKSDSMPNPLLCWWNHLAFFNVVQQTPNPTRIKWFKARCYREPNFWPFISFWLGQSKPDSVKYTSKTQFLQLSTQYNLPDNYPLFFNDTTSPLLHIKHTQSLSLSSLVYLSKNLSF